MGKYDPDNFIDTPAAGAPAAADKYAPDNFVAPPPAAPPGANRTWGDTLRSAGQTAIDFGTAAGSSATFGLDVRRDALAGWLAGDYPSYSAGVEAERAKLAKQRERSPIASVAGDVAGAVALPGMGGAGLAARMGGRALARGIGYGAEGMAVGALQGAGNTFTGKPIDYLTNATTGGVMGGVLGGLGGAAFGPAGGMRSTAQAPSGAQQGAARDIAYDTLRANPAQYTPSSFAQRADEATHALRRENYYNAPAAEGGSPRTFNTVEQMRLPPTAVNPATGAATHITPADIDVVRKGVTGDRLPVTEQGAGRIVRRNIDDFLQNPPPGSVVPGHEANAALAAHQSRMAHELHAGTKRTEVLEEMIRNSERTAGATHAGLNLRNELQKTIRSGLKEKAGDSPFSKAGYNDAEMAALDYFSRGQGAISRGLGYADKYLGGGGGLGALVAGGVGSEYLGGGATTGLGVTGTGLALRALGNRRAARDINELRDMISRRNPLYQQRAANAPMAPPPGGGGVANARDALTTELVKQGYFQTDDGKLIPRITVNADYGQ
jgi:hypothetical protein